jgi:pyruvate kinase
MERRAKIVATLGPASAQADVFDRLLAAGLDVVRLNLSHGTQETHAQNLALVRQRAAAVGRHIPVIADLMGPRYRLGVLASPRLLAVDETVRLGPSSSTVDLPIEDPEFLAHLEVGERILIDNGLIELQVTAKQALELAARVVTGGTVSTRKGINLPDTALPFDVGDKDRSDIDFAVREGVDLIAASYVGSGADVAAVRAVVRSLGSAIPIIAKLERLTAVEHLEDIVGEADAVMVARGDLGVEVPLFRVPVLQKEIVAAGRRMGIPVIVATQMLESMIDHPRPTRAESSDVANAVFDGADALMLSGETAVGQYAVETVSTMARIIVEAEAYRRQRGADLPVDALTDLAQQAIVRPGHQKPGSDIGVDLPEAIAAAAVHAAERIGASAIVAYSQGGFTARLVARHRPRAPILAVTNDEAIARRVSLIWGVQPLLLESHVSTSDEVTRVVERRLLSAGLAKPGDAILVLMGDPIDERPLTNLLRAHRIRPPSESAIPAPPATPTAPRPLTDEDGFGD